MQTSFTPQQLQDKGIAEAEKILRKCVHCGFCTATCPTYLTLGDELDSPRGRIYLIKDMLENNRPADQKLVTHIDRCLSCLACMTTCPSGVNYMHLVDEARVWIERTHTRPRHERIMRRMLAEILPFPARFRAALMVSRLARPFRNVIRRIPKLQPIDALLGLVPSSLPRANTGAKIGTHPAILREDGTKRARVAILSGCAQSVLDPGINAAAVELLNSLAIEVVVPRGEGCCGALVHHLGRENDSLAAARRNIDVWAGEIAKGGLDAIIITTSGCGTTIKDYGYMLRADPAYAEKAKLVSSLAKDITEYLSGLDLPEVTTGRGFRLAYHSACSLQHGQKITQEPKRLLKQAGFEVMDIPEGHLCCGSAGTYNILQPEISGRLKARKLANINRIKPDIIAAGNIGCMMQIGSASAIPIFHTVELLNWAHGGRRPTRLPKAGPENGA